MVTMCVVAKNETWRDPKAVAIWVMVALVLWLVILASPQLGRLVWEWTSDGGHPVADPTAPPPWWIHGVVAALLAVALVVAVCVKLRLGLWWLLCALLFSSFIFLFKMNMPEPFGSLAFLVVPPVAGALIFKPKAYAEPS